MADKKTILVTGANGQLGSEMQAIAVDYPDYDFLFVTRNELPIDDEAALEKYFSMHRIDYCVNCAAYTAVDKAEIETEKAFLINAVAVGNLAKYCKAQKAAFIHISTDYVFDGTSTNPYKEEDKVNPVNLYGASKLKGEALAILNNPDSIIIRTSWVYSSIGNNFVKTMLRLMKERESIQVVSDQLGCPTYAADLASAIMQIIEQLNKNTELLNQQGEAAHIFNYSNQGVINWHQFALAIKELSGSACAVNPIPSSQYPTPAKRPQYSVMDTSKIQQTFHLAIPYWKDSLIKCISKLLV
jgi:dTDP-4-dehydrorhamnose reductase